MNSLNKALFASAMLLTGSAAYADPADAPAPAPQAAGTREPCETDLRVAFTDMVAAEKEQVFSDAGTAEDFIRLVILEDTREALVDPAHKILPSTDEANKRSIAINGPRTDEELKMPEECIGYAAQRLVTLPSLPPPPPPAQPPGTISYLRPETSSRIPTAAL